MTATTAVSLQPTHLLTVAEFAALDEVEHGHIELQEGSLVMSPSPTPRHNRAAYQIATQLEEQAPEHLAAILDVDIDLQLVPANQPGFSRRPDLIMVERVALDRVEAEGGILRASEVTLVIEVLSAGSRRTDTLVKRAEYADAGIPHYWIVDIDKPVSLVPCHLAEGGGYRDEAPVGNAYRSDQPFPLALELDNLY